MSTQQMKNGEKIKHFKTTKCQELQHTFQY
jgi:hypothetical protein